MSTDHPVSHPATPEDLFARLDALDIATTTQRHAPVFTVESSKDLRGQLPGGHCKSLFLKDKKGLCWLVVTLEDGRVDIKALAKQIGAGRLSFGKPELLMVTLGVEPGSVTPFALINPSAEDVRVVLETAMMTLNPLNYHPLKNDQTTAIAPEDLLRFIRACGHEPQIIDLPTPQAAP